jgi:hypothetical protein
MCGAFFGNGSLITIAGVHTRAFGPGIPESPPDSLAPSSRGHRVRVARRVVAKSRFSMAFTTRIVMKRPPHDEFRNTSFGLAEYNPRFGDIIGSHQVSRWP